MALSSALDTVNAAQTVESLKRQEALLESLLWEQQQTSRMLWAALTDEQRIECNAATPDVEPEAV